jgi:hypothetical protein
MDLLVSEDASFVTGAVVDANGGWSNERPMLGVNMPSPPRRVNGRK